MELTNEQQSVVNTRGKNILVAAAAGSGKTRVLVQRIIDEILDENNPIDVDRILVVTFTNAAAAEMRERIRKEIDKAVNDNPKRGDLRRQATLIHNAQIRTIDSFCSWVVKNYFYEIDQDPSFRIGSKGELSLLSDQVLDDIFAEKFEKNDELFRRLSDAYITGKKVSELKKKILSIYEKANSFAWPFEWYESVIQLYQANSLEEFEKSELLNAILVDALEKCKQFARKTQIALDLYDPTVAAKDRLVLENEHNAYVLASEAKSFNELQSCIAGINFATYRASEKALGMDKALAKTLRDQCKEGLISIRNDYFEQSLEDAYADFLLIKEQLETLVDTTREFETRYAQIKKKKNIYSFNDIEHMALEILRNKESKEHEKRPVAVELSEFFAEVMVDEYQDSNRLQEAILTAVARDNNYFTVGDVKQSIYAFRQADPAIFMEKFSGYLSSTDKNIRIDLDKNFRSRSQVLEFCNHVFEPLMQSDMGGVDYDEAAKLKVGVETFPGNPEDYQPEMLIANLDAASMRTYEIKNSDEFEAHIIANQIQKMIKNKFQVSTLNQDNKLISRDISLSDIAILMRATDSHADVFLKVFKQYNIPAYVESETGFFERDEVRTVLSMLEVIDNPNNDIPLASVLHSAMFDVTSEELGIVRAKKRDGTLYESIKSYVLDSDNCSKLKKFIDTLDQLRSAGVDTPTHEIIMSVLRLTGYDLYVNALPFGQAAVANINKLVDEAIRYENSASKSLSGFVAYIHNLKSYQEELGLAKVISENDAAVRIMTIHKSKGLEFPVVFLARSGAGFNTSSGDLSYHPSVGIGLSYKNPNTRVERSSIVQKLIDYRTKADCYGEEQRILYVALTRAKEKLFIIGGISPTEKESIADKIDAMTAMPGAVLSIDDKFASKSYMEWMIRALRASETSYSRKIISCEDLIIQEAEKRVEKQLVRKAIETIAEIDDAEIAHTMEMKMSHTYTSELDSGYKQKYSVSEIKHHAMEENFALSEDAAPAFIFSEEESFVPSFMREDNQALGLNEISVPAGALYGTAMHRVMECFDFSQEDYNSSLNRQLNYMKETHSLSAEDSKRINYKKLQSFLDSDLAYRMHIADEKGLLYKEQPFVLGSNPLELFGDSESLQTLTLVQGIIDVFFEEDDGIVLMDYKTDKVDEPKDLVVRYEKQLRLYQSAIEKAYKTKVKEVLIYSFSLDCTIAL